MSNAQMWQVQLPDGAVHQVTVDQLDAAFESGHINESTLVREVGSAHWSTLGQMAGLDAEPAAVSAPPPSSMAPHAYSLAPSAPSMPIAQSAPAMSDLDLDFPQPKKKTGLIVGGVVAVAAIALGALGISAASSGGTAEAPKAAAALAAPPPAAAAVPAADPNANPFADSVANSASRLTEEQKKALMEADQKREAASKARSTQRAESAPARGGAPHRKSVGGNVFHKGGNQYDPLNSNL